MRKRALTLLIAASFALLFAGGCREEGGAEKLGKQIDEAAESAGEAMEDAAEEAKKKLEKE